MDRDLWFVDEFERLRQAHEGGAATALHEAAVLALWNGHPVPSWAADAVVDMVRCDMLARPGRGKGVPTPAAAADKQRRDEAIFEWVAHFRSQGMTRRAAEKRVAQLAEKHVTQAAIERTVDRENRRRRTPGEGP